MDHTLRLWNVETGKPEMIYHGHTAGIHRVQLLPDGKRFVSVSDDHTLRLWDRAAGKELARGFAGGEVWGVAVAADGKSCLTAAENGALLLWDLPETK